MSHTEQMREALQTGLEYAKQVLIEHDVMYDRHPATESSRNIITADIAELERALAALTAPAAEVPDVHVERVLEVATALRKGTQNMPTMQEAAKLLEDVYLTLREQEIARDLAEVPEPSPDDLIRVAVFVFGLGESELCTKYEHVQHEVESHLDDGTPEPEDSPTYTLTFKTMTRAEFDALGEFDGF